MDCKNMLEACFYPTDFSATRLRGDNKTELWAGKKAPEDS